MNMILHFAFSKWGIISDAKLVECRRRHIPPSLWTAQHAIKKSIYTVISGLDVDSSELCSRPPGYMDESSG